VLRRVIALTVVSTFIGPLPFATAATSDATFVRQANTVCRAEGAKISAVPELTDGNEVVVLGQLADLVSGIARKLSRIEAPPAKAAKYRAYLTTTRESVTLLRRTIAAIKRRDAADARASMRQALAADDRGSAYAAALGLPDCAKDY
jgi:hypothetical protein